MHEGMLLFGGKSKRGKSWLMLDLGLALLTHLRKAEADDGFDTLHGSVAYQGTQDVLLVLERRPHDQVCVLHPATRMPRTGRCTSPMWMATGSFWDTTPM